MFYILHLNGGEFRFDDFDSCLKAYQAMDDSLDTYDIYMSHNGVIIDQNHACWEINEKP